MRLAVMVWLGLVTACWGLRPTPPAESLLDRGLDWGLALFRVALGGPLALPVPPFRHPFVEGLVPGEVEAGGGYFGDFATIRRTGAARGARDGYRLSLGADLTLEDFAVGYRNYSVRFGESWESGELVLHAAENALRLEVELDLRRPLCSLSVSLSLTGVTGAEAAVLRLGDFRPLMEVLSRWAVRTFRERLLARANLALRRLHDRIAARVCQPKQPGLSPHLQLQAGWDECIIHKCAAFPA